MKALVVAPQPFYSPRGTPLSVYYRTSVAASLGLEMDLLTYGQGEDVDIEGVRILRIPAFRALGSVRVGPSLLKAFLDIFVFLRMGVLLARNRYDFVHAHEEAVFMCLAWQPVFRFRYVYDMHSSLPRQLSNFAYTESPLLTDLFEILERKALREADAVITVCPDLYDYALERVPDVSRLLLIENSLFDTVRVTGRQNLESTESDPDEEPPASQFVFYAGTLEPYQGISLLLQAFARVAADIEDVDLIVAGGTARQVEAYRSEATAMGLGARCRFLGPVPRDRVLKLAKTAAVLVSTRTAGTNVPLKVYEQLASGIPLVATDVYAHTQVLSNEVAFLAPPEPEGFSRALLRALTDRAEAERRVDNARALYASRYDAAAYRENMKTLLDGMD